MTDPDKSGPHRPCSSRAETACTTSGTTKAVPIKKTADLSFRPNVLLVSKLDPTRVWIGLFDGLASFRWIGGRWIEEGRVDGRRLRDPVAVRGA